MAEDIYTSSDTWTCPAGVTSVDVECWGGGGGGAGDASDGGDGTDAQPGVGGTGGTADGGDGGDGGNSSDGGDGESLSGGGGGGYGGYGGGDGFRGEVRITYTEGGVNVSDGVEVGENVTLLKSALDVNVSDGVEVGENVALLKSSLDINVSDGVEVGESTTPNIPTLHINVSDGVEVTESISSFLINSVNVNDGIKIRSTCSSNSGVDMGAVSPSNYWHNDDGASAKYNIVDNSFTFEAWIMPHNASTTEASGKLEDTSGDWAFYQSGTAMYALIYHSGGSQTFQFVATVDTSAWHHFAMCYDNSTNKMHVYYDGTQVGSGTTVGGTFPASNSSKFWIGRVGTIAVNWSFDEMRVSDTRRYTSDFTPQTTPFEDDANTILLFHFDEGSGNSVIDSSSNPIDMTAVGSPPDSWVVGPVQGDPNVEIKDYVDIQDSIEVAEDITIETSSVNLDINVSDGVEATESITSNANPQSINVFDGVEVTDDITIDQVLSPLSVELNDYIWGVQLVTN